jgi:hypothetical protein
MTKKFNPAAGDGMIPYPRWKPAMTFFDRLALSLALVIALGSTARAGDTVGVIPDGDGALQPQLQAQIADWLTRHGHTVVATPFPPDVVAQFTDQMKTGNPGNARDVVERSATTQSVVYARAEAKKASARDVSVTVSWLVKGHDVATQQQDCARCTDPLLRATIDDLLKKLIGGAVGHVKLKSSPPGARIVIDGQAIGVTPLDWDLPTGTHAIAMDKAGLAPASGEVTITADKTELFILTLEAPSSSGGGRSRALPVATLVVGGLALAAGGVLLAIDEDPGDPNQKTYRDTGPAGLGLAVGGAAVALAGGFWLWHASHARSAPVAAITGSSAFLGWTGRF